MAIKAVILAGAVAIGAANFAEAADLGLPPPPVVEPAPAPVVAGGWYLRGDVGAGFDELSRFHSSDEFIVPGYSFEGAGLGRQAIFGGGVGYQVNNWIRFDVTGEYRTATKYWAIENYAGTPPPCTTCLDDYSAHVSTFDVLGNGYVDLGTWYGFTPFVGAGVGAAFHQFQGLTDVGVQTGGFGVAPTSNTGQFAWDATAGVAYSFTPNWKLELSYRYIDMGNVKSDAIICVAGCTHEVQSFHIASNDVRLGLRYVFADIPAPAPPLVTKY